MTDAVNDERISYDSDFSDEEEQIINSLVDAYSLEKISNVHSCVALRENIRFLHIEIEGAPDTPCFNKEISQLQKLQNDAQKGTKFEGSLLDPSPSQTISPLKRFRAQSFKNLSVSDLVAPAWCELKFWYSLTRHGDVEKTIKKTIQMKKGAQIHKKLERELFTPIKVETQSKEEKWGLRIWNTIQGLQVLRHHGYTRELAIWGVIDQQVVGGKIDELSYNSPDPIVKTSCKKIDMERSLAQEETPSQYPDDSGDTPITLGTETFYPDDRRKVYLCDVKTRDVRHLPSEDSIRPTKVQLMLYHRLISALISDNVDLEILTTRFKLDSSKTFSDSFLAQAINLNQTTLDPSSGAQQDVKNGLNSSEDYASTVLAHNNISSLWSHMIENFQLAFPEGVDSLGEILKVEYRSRTHGEIIATKTFTMDDNYLTKYIDHSMQWWRGEREAEGVAEHEAFKCWNCEFAETCDWRLNKVKETLQKVNLKRKPLEAPDE